MNEAAAKPQSGAEVAEISSGTPLPRALAGSGLRRGAYRGVETVAAFGGAEAELRAARCGAVVHDLGWRRRVAVAGEDRMRWLSGMVTNHVAGLGDGEGNFNLVLNAQGRIQGDCRVWRTGAGPELELEVDENQREALLGHLERFIIMDDVELRPVTGWTALGVTGPEAGRVLQGALQADAQAMQPGGLLASALRGPDAATAVEVRRETGRQSGHWSVWCREADAAAVWQALETAGAQPVGCETVERLRIVEGMPAFGVDFAGDTLPQETALDEALHFAKGCYLGQEIVERIHSRGQVHRHVRALEIFPDGQKPAVGMELSRADAPEKPVAKLTSVTSVEMDGARRWFALGMVKAEAETGAGELQYAGGRARRITG